MRFTTPPTMRVIKKEEKEARLKDLLTTHIRQQADRGAESASLMLVVRSQESPVVGALAALAGELAGAGLSLDVVVALPGEDGRVAWPDALTGISRCTVVADARLLDAHEQLWLDEQTVWIGDCMRREPAKRDAYECYSLACRTTAASVRSTFEAFRRRAVPASFACDTAPAADAATAASLDTTLASLAGNDQPPPTAMTRH